jgi:hypothetical protein
MKARKTGATVVLAGGLVLAFAALLVAACAIPAVAAGATGSGPGHNDADLVVLLASTDLKTAAMERKALRPFLKSLTPRLRVAFVSVKRILHRASSDSLAPEMVRDYLRSRFTWRASTETRPRYLGIFAPPTPYYTGTLSTLPAIPRFTINTGTNVFPTDVPYEFLSSDTIDGGDGTVDPGDLDVTAPTFEVFRVPVTEVDDFTTFTRRHEIFSSAPYRSDATLVAGHFGLFEGDTSLVQCVNANNIGPSGLATHVLKVFDSMTQCQPDVLTTAAGPTLADVLADPNGGFHGGFIVDISHGNSFAIYPDPGSYENLSASDVASIPTDRLNVFISLACDNDGSDSLPNLAAAMYARASVAVISATTSVFPVNVQDILFAEVDSVSGLWQQNVNLLQGFHVFRSEYYTRFVQPATGVEREELWVNVMTEQLIGDGFVRAAR